MLRWFEELSDRGIFTTDPSLVGVVHGIRGWEAQTGFPALVAIGTPLM